jgi:flavin-dependent dehydrogenase
VTAAAARTKRTVDLIVAGGGPVGLVTALEARRRGLEVAVVEPRPSPVDKACGEGLMPTAAGRLRALGVTVQGRPFVGIRYVGLDREVAATFRHGPGLGVRRTALHAALAAAAERAGVCRVEGRVRDVTDDGTTVQAGGMRARWLVAADGLHSTVRREAGLDVPAEGRSPVRFGIRRHYAVQPWTDHVEVHWADGHEAYVTPVADDLVGVAVLGPAGTGFDEALDALPALTARLRGAPAVTELRGAGPLRQTARSVRKGRILLVGDAAGYVDALTGEGLSTGFTAAHEAVAAIAAGQPESYPRAWSRATRRHRLLTGTLLGLTAKEGPRGLLVPAAARLPRVFGAAVDLLA